MAEVDVSQRKVAGSIFRHTIDDGWVWGRGLGGVPYFTGSGRLSHNGSTPMGDGFAAAFSNGNKNVWGQPLEFLEPESEHSSASACEGFALAGGRVTNFTSGQGLILMKEVLYVIAGKRLPVFHVGARAITSQSLNIYCGHDDVMAVADCR